LRSPNIEREKVCPCGKSFTALSDKALYCSCYCRNKYNPNKGSHGNKYKIKYLYGITVEEYNELFQEQEGCCKICGKHQTAFKRKLDVDHCHETGKIRGLLCNRCNQALGLMKDSPENIKAMLEYVS
jgi:hypothetical protein